MRSTNFGNLDYPFFLYSALLTAPSHLASQTRDTHRCSVIVAALHPSTRRSVSQVRSKSSLVSARAAFFSADGGAPLNSVRIGLLDPVRTPGDLCAKVTLRTNSPVCRPDSR